MNGPRQAERDTNRRYSRACAAAVLLHAAAATGAWYTVSGASTRADWASSDEPSTFSVSLSLRERPQPVAELRPVEPTVQREAPPDETPMALPPGPDQSLDDPSLWLGSGRPATPPATAMPAPKPPDWLQRIRRSEPAPPATQAPPPGAIAAGGFVAASIVPGSNRAPDYPVTAYHHGWTGTVTVVLEIDADGNVTGAHVLEGGSSGHSSLDDAALRALHAWHFQPARDHGKPVRSTFRQQVTFRLVDGRPSSDVR